MGRRKKDEIKFEFGPNEKLTSKEKATFRKSKQWIEFRNKTIKNRGNKCELCGISSSLTLHHIHLNDNAQSYTDLREERFKVFCQNCHRFIHAKQRSLVRKKDPPKMDERLEQIINENIIIDKES